MIKDELVSIRVFLGITQAELAKKADVTTATISHFETGQRIPSLESFVKICKGLGVSPNRLLNWEEE